MQQLPPQQPEHHTLYVKNINDQIKKETLKKSLYLLFSSCGEVIEVHMRGSAKYRGQAWVVFKSSRDALRAKTKLQDTIFYGKGLNIAFSSEKSDIISKADGTYEKKVEKKLRELEQQKADLLGDNVMLKKRPLDGDDDGDNIGDVKRDRNGRPSLNVSDEPTAVLFAINLPPVDSDATLKTFFKDAIEITKISVSDCQHLYTQLEVKKNEVGRPIYKIKYSSPQIATTQLNALQRTKYDDDHRLKLAYCYEIPDIDAEATVSL
jgi:RNA recognition motif-containing protein